MSLLQNRTSMNFGPREDEEDGGVREREAEPVGERFVILEPTGVQRPV
jgi:hypothetical protein